MRIKKTYTWIYYVYMHGDLKTVNNMWSFEFHDNLSLAFYLQHH